MKSIEAKVVVLGSQGMLLFFSPFLSSGSIFTLVPVCDAHAYPAVTNCPSLLTARCLGQQQGPLIFGFCIKCVHVSVSANFVFLFVCVVLSFTVFRSIHNHYADCYTTFNGVQTLSLFTFQKLVMLGTPQPVTVAGMVKIEYLKTG